jgi:hypothetical protein
MTEPQRLAVHPHHLTRPGTLVTVPHEPGDYVVVSGFIAYQDTKPRNTYVLRDAAGELHACINGWLTPFDWLAERLAQLQAAGREEQALRAAVAQAHARRPD